MGRDYTAEAKVFKAFCDEKRLRILDLLRDGEKCACVLNEEMGMPQSTLSYHMKILCESGAAIPRQDGKWTHYRVSPEGVKKAMEILRGVAASKAGRQEPAMRCAAT